MGRRSKKKSKGSGSTPSKKQKKKQQRAAPQDAPGPTSTSTMEAPPSGSLQTNMQPSMSEPEPMLIDEAVMTDATGAGAANVVSPSPPARGGKSQSMPSSSKKRGVQPPPPPAIPPPPAPADNGPGMPSMSGSSMSDSKAKSAKASSAVMDAGGITRGLLSSPPPGPAQAMAQMAEETSPEKFARIDVSDAERRRRIAAGYDDADASLDRGMGRRMYEEDNAGYGRQRLLATSGHQALPSPVLVALPTSMPEDARHGGSEAAGRSNLVEPNSAAPPTRAEFEGSGNGGDDQAAAASGEGPSASASAAAAASACTAVGSGASRRAEMAARLRALRGVGAGSADEVGGRSESSKSGSKSGGSVPAPPSIAPPSTTTTAAANISSGGMAAKIRRLNDDRGKGTTGAQQRAAELGELRSFDVAVAYILYMLPWFVLLCGDGRWDKIRLFLVWGNIFLFASHLRQ